MELTPDVIEVAQLGPFRLNATIVNTWIVMALLVGVSWAVTRRLRPDAPPGRLRNALEVVVQMIEDQIRAVTRVAVHQVLYFAGTLLLFIAVSNALGVVPGFRSPTGSLSTTVALTLAVLLAVPIFSISRGGVGHYLRTFAQPTVLLLPLNILGEVSRAISLSVRLYGNVMSGAVIVAILLTVAPFFFPVVMQLFGLLAGLVQAYIFSILAAVYISSAMPEPQAGQEDET